MAWKAHESPIISEEEWQKRFPLLEMEMTDHNLKIRLANDKASLIATLPKEMIEAIVSKWQAFQNGTATEKVAMSRHYTGAWSTEA